MKKQDFLDYIKDCCNDIFKVEEVDSKQRLVLNKNCYWTLFDYTICEGNGDINDHFIKYSKVDEVDFSIYNGIGNNFTVNTKYPTSSFKEYCHKKGILVKKSFDNIRDYFYDYLENYGGDAGTFDYTSEVVLSFAGSDGPEITPEGVDSEWGFIKFEDTETLDEYIKGGCGENYSVFAGGHKPNYPTKTWTEYYKEYVK